METYSEASHLKKPSYPLRFGGTKGENSISRTKWEVTIQRRSGLVGTLVVEAYTIARAVVWEKGKDTQPLLFPAYFLQVPPTSWTQLMPEVKGATRASLSGHRTVRRREENRMGGGKWKLTDTYSHTQIWFHVLISFGPMFFLIHQVDTHFKHTFL